MQSTGNICRIKNKIRCSIKLSEYQVQSTGDICRINTFRKKQGTEYWQYL
jgi:hypothetical protein